jgi:tetratricopeptide (TPR) repeat protein
VGELDEIVGYHYEQAFRNREQLGPLDDAARLLAQRAADLLGNAGQRAYARDDITAAVTLLDRALALVTEQDPTKLELERELSGALWSTGEISRAEALLNGVIEVATATGNRSLQWYSILERSGRRAQADPSAATEEGLATAREAVKVFEELGDDRGLARAWREIYSAHQELCLFADAEEASAKALDFARRAGDGREESRSADALCTCLLYGPTPAGEAIHRCERLLAEASGKPLLEANVLTALAGLKGMCAEFGAARAAIASAERIYDQLGLRLAIAGLTQVAGPLELLAGDAQAAEHTLSRGYEILEHMTRAKSYQAVLLAEAVHAQGRSERARDLVAEVEESGMGGLVGRIHWRIVSSKLTAETEGAVGALDLAESAVALAATTDALNLHADALTNLAEVLHAAGRIDEATERNHEAVSLYERKGNVARLSQVAADRATARA